MDVSLLGSIAARCSPKTKKPTKGIAGDGSSSIEIGQATYSNPPAHGGDNTYNHKNGMGRGEASNRGSGETSNSGYAGADGVSIAKPLLVEEATSTQSHD